MSTYKDLIVWGKSIELCEKIYRITETFPKSELYGLVSQMRRCCVSIPSNIAEGQRRGHKGEFIQFLRISFGSGAELETQLVIALKIDYINQQQYQELNAGLEEIMRMLNKLLSTIK
ncbi:MAG TPA: four helix bundle protein [Candidatus Saccharimonadales bacterium]|nr:four helix bundle protein [Candidatus Saccharimonadales bacterium]